MNDKINGICIGGKFYEAVKGTFSCNGCAFIGKNRNCTIDTMLCHAYTTSNIILKFSQELTDKLNEK